jgi:hypothetical protein
MSNRAGLIWHLAAGAVAVGALAAALVGARGFAFIACLVGLGVTAAAWLSSLTRVAQGVAIAFGVIDIAVAAYLIFAVATLDAR